MSTQSSSPQLIEDLSLVFTDSTSSLPASNWTAGVALLLSIGGIIYWNWKRKRAVRQAKFASCAGFLDGPPEVWALRQLAELRKRTYMLAPHSFALEVSEILRVFLERRFDLRAAHQSTEEFLFDAREGVVLSPRQQERLRDFLGCCDQAKIGRRSLAATRKRSLLESALCVVNEAKSPAATAVASGARATDRQVVDGGRRTMRASAA